MKKVLIVLAALLLIAVPVFAQKGQFSAGLEAGYPAAGLAGSYGITDELNAYATVGYDYGNGLELGLGAEYKVCEFSIQKESFDVLVGAQVDPRFNFSAKHFNLGAFGTVAVAYDFTVKAEKTALDFTAYLRAGAGINVFFANKVDVDFAWLGALGLVYHI